MVQRGGTRLIDAHPWAADQWADDPELLTTINVSSPIKVRWRCVEGHEFIESPNVRRGNQGWKRGRTDACPFCLRQRYTVVYRCGHAQELRGSSEPESPELHAKTAQVDCYACRPPRKAWRTPEHPAEKERTHGPDTKAPSTSPGLKVGDVQQSRNPVTSGIEEKVRDAIRAAGYKVPKVKMAVLCHHPKPKHPILSITPDIVLVKHKIAIEVDPCGVTDRYYTHTGEEEKDRVRNGLLEAAGWCVIRLRLGAKKGAHIGKRDVVVESSGFTKEAEVALREAIEDKIANRRAKVRVVKKGKTPAKAQRRSTVVNIRANGYTADGHYFNWLPNLDKPDKHRMRLCANGRYLYETDPWGDLAFVADVGLHNVPPTEWRDRLEATLQGMEPTKMGTTRWPWGDTLLATSEHHHDSQTIVDVCESYAHIDKATFYFTTNCDDLARWAPTTLTTDDDTVIVSLTPEAVDAGYRFASVEQLTGYRGPYQRVVVTREPPDENP